MDLDGQLALVTGDTSGIGRSTAEAPAAAGARVFLALSPVDGRRVAE